MHPSIRPEPTLDNALPVLPMELLIDATLSNVDDVETVWALLSVSPAYLILVPQFGQ